MARKKSFEKTYETFQYIQTEYGDFGFLVSFAIWVIGCPEMAKIVAKFVFFKDLTARFVTKDRAQKKYICYERNGNGWPSNTKSQNG